MSGGAFEYRQNQIDWIIEGIEDHFESMGKEKGDVNDPMKDFYSKYPEARIYPVEGAYETRYRGFEDSQGIRSTCGLVLEWR
jgi:hypothetical protein